MVEAICTRLIEDKYGRLVGYRLLYKDGNFEDIMEYNLADKVRKHEIYVSNLQYNELYDNFSFKTYHNRMEYLNITANIIKEHCPLHKYNNNEIKVVSLRDWINKAKLLGIEIEKVIMHDRTVAYYAELNENLHQIYIPDDVKYTHGPILRFIPRYSELGYLKSLTDDLSVWDKLMELLVRLTGTVQLLGGISIADVHDLFGIYNPELSLDLTKLNLDNVIDFYGMFNASTLHSVKFGTVKLNNYASMNDMFNYAKIREIHMENVYTDNVISYENMFRGCKSNLVDITNFDVARAFNYRKDALENMFSDSEINLKTNCKYILDAYNNKK